MHLCLCDRKAALAEAWRDAFAGESEVEVVTGDVLSSRCDAIVSPANSFGFMDGGLDLLLSQFFGWHVQERVQAAIRSRPLRELLVGEAILVPTDHPGIPWLIAAPTMRVPMVVRDSLNAYLAMKGLLVAVREHTQGRPIRSVAIPGLATGTGRIPPRIAARQMYAAYAEIVKEAARFPASFVEAQCDHVSLNPEASLWEE